jgi:hypothetical protein
VLPNSFFHTLNVTVSSLVYVLNVVTVTTVSLDLAVIWNIQLGVCKNDAVVFVALASIFVVANGVPQEAVAVLDVQVQLNVTVILPQSCGNTEYICLVTVDTLPPAVELTQA